MKTKKSIINNFTKIFVLFWIVLASYATNAQEIRTVYYSPTDFKKIDNKVEEISGIVYYDNYLWGHNDSGGKTNIYAINPKTGEVSKTKTISACRSNDWEDISQNKESFFIGDFGNNRGNRKDLTIYIVNKKSLYEKSIIPKKITFRYAKQKDFTIRNHKHNFDAEALAYLNDTLWLFSKNWDNHKTYLYKIEAKPGDYTLSPSDSLDVDALITGASFSPDGKTLVLSAYRNYVPCIITIKDFPEGEPFAGTCLKIDMPKTAGIQTEGVCFKDENTVFLSAEKTRIFPQGFFTIPLSDLEGEKTNSEPDFEYEIHRISNNDSNDEILMLFGKENIVGPVSILAYSKKGRLIRKREILEGDTKEKISIKIPSDKKSKWYYLEILSPNGRTVRKVD